MLDMSNQAPQKRKRPYRHRVTFSECKKDIVVSTKTLMQEPSTQATKLNLLFLVRQINRS